MKLIDKILAGTCSLSRYLCEDQQPSQKNRYYISLGSSGADCNIWACASMCMLEDIVASFGRFAPLRSSHATVAPMMYGTMPTPPVHCQLTGLQRRVRAAGRTI